MSKVILMANIKNVKMEIPNSILRILKQNHWNKFNFELMKQNYLDKLKHNYSKYDYPMTSALLEKITIFYNIRLKFANQELFFDIKKINKYRQAFLNLQAAKFGVKKIVYLGDIHPGYITIWLDEQEQVWGDYDDIIYLYGRGLFNGIENILTGNFTIKSKLNPNNQF